MIPTPGDRWKMGAVFRPEFFPVTFPAVSRGFGGKRRKGKRRIEKCRRKNRKISKRKMKVVKRAKMHMSKEKI
jgi:hypothetical protein